MYKRQRDEWLNRMVCQSNEKNIYLYAWTRLLYSLLVAADYYATSEFMNGYENNDYGNVNNIDNIINEYENNDVQKSIHSYEEKIKRLDEEQFAKVNKDTVTVSYTHLDHIEAGKAMDIYNNLGLGKLDCQVAIIKNARSSKMGRKDIIKIEGGLDLVDLDVYKRQLLITEQQRRAGLSTAAHLRRSS